MVYNGSAKWSAGIESGKFSIRTELSQTNFWGLNYQKKTSKLVLAEERSRGFDLPLNPALHLAIVVKRFSFLWHYQKLLQLRLLELYQLLIPRKKV